LSEGAQAVDVVHFEPLQHQFVYPYAREELYALDDALRSADQGVPTRLYRFNGLLERFVRQLGRLATKVKLPFQFIHVAPKE
jgi:hypothetical protein